MTADLRRRGPVVVPGAAIRGFTLGAEADDPAPALAAITEYLAARKNDHVQRALAELDGTDRVLYPLAALVRPRITGIWKDYEQRLAAARSDPRRALLNEAGVRDVEGRLAATRDAALAEAAAQLTARLTAITDRLDARAAALRVGVSAEDEQTATALVNKLAYLGPSHGLPELAAFVSDVIDGERPLGALAEALAPLRSLYDRDGEWRSHDDLLALIRAGEQLTDGGWQRAVVEARQERAARLQGELGAFLALSREGLATLEARDAVTGAYALFPELAPPTPGADDGEPARPRTPPPIRRLAITAERRAADAARVAAQADADDADA